jgi:hypothetical protein
MEQDKAVVADTWCKGCGVVFDQTLNPNPMDHQSTENPELCNYCAKHPEVVNFKF